MTQTLQTPVKTSSKEVLARLLASENITVEHQASAETASFDVKNRVLTLPIWEDMTNDIYDMLVGHETAHAIWTPYEGWAETMDRKGERYRQIYQTFVNIVEDARIERNIKAKFPGLRRDFYSAYRSLSTRDIFDIGNKDIEDLPLIDRINLHFKIGSFLPVPFSAEEQSWVDKVGNTKTFEEVCDLSSDLFDYHVDQSDDDEEEFTPPQTMGIPVQMSGDDDDEDGEGENSGSDPSDGDEEESGSDSSNGDEESDEESSGSGSDSSDDETSDEEDSGESMKDDTDDGDSAEGETKSGESNRESLGNADYKSDIAQYGGGTQNAFDRAISDMRDASSRERNYHNLPKFNSESVIIDYKQVHETIASSILESENQQRGFAYATSEATSFTNKSRKTVNMMAQQFIRRQAADEHHRTSIAQTGILDVNKMINYKWSEDLFLRNEEIADGKNHGLVLFVDWSGSMSGIIEDTIKQMLQLVMFCKKVGIPFEVYSFSSQSALPPDWSTLTSTEQAEWKESYQAPFSWPNEVDEDEENNPVSRNWLQQRFSLQNYLSSRMSSREFKDAMNHMMYLAIGFASRHRWDNRTDGMYCRTPRGHDLGSTPLNEAVVAALEIVPKFQNENKLQIVNTIFLTDGQASSGFWGCGVPGDNYVTDPKSKKSYSAVRGHKGEGLTSALLDCLQDRTGANAIGIFLDTSKKINYGYTEEQIRSWKKDGFCSTDQAGYTEYFVVKADRKVDNDFLENLNDDASFTKIKNAFMKASSDRVNSRILLGRVIDLIAS